VTFEETIDFGGKRRGFDFDFFGSHNSRMYRIDIAMFILSIGTISAGHNRTTEAARVSVNRRYCRAARFLGG